MMAADEAVNPRAYPLADANLTTQVFFFVLVFMILK